MRPRKDHIFARMPTLLSRYIGNRESSHICFHKSFALEANNCYRSVHVILSRYAGGVVVPGAQGVQFNLIGAFEVWLGNLR